MYDITDMWNVKQNKNKNKLIDTDNRLMVIKGWGRVVGEVIEMSIGGQKV